MKSRNMFLALVIMAGLYSQGFSTPSTENWTAGTSDIQPFGVLHIGVDNYFSIIRPSHTATPWALPTDFGLTLGVLPFKNVQMEVGFDLFEPSDDPFALNARIGVPENAFLKWSPSIAAGILGLGIKQGVTDQNVGYVAVGKTIPVVGRLFVGGYYGNDKLLGTKTNDGITVAFDRAFFPAKSASGADYNKIVLSADWASGLNALGGGGAGIFYFFNENISLLTGPVWFTSNKVNGDWKWTMQLDVNTAKIF